MIEKASNKMSETDIYFLPFRQSLINNSLTVYLLNNIEYDVQQHLNISVFFNADPHPFSGGRIDHLRHTMVSVREILSPPTGVKCQSILIILYWSMLT